MHVNKETEEKITVPHKLQPNPEKGYEQQNMSYGDLIKFKNLIGKK